MKKRYFSIIIPLFNKEREIATTLKSVIDQTYPHFEILIIDDGSTDDSLAAIRQFKDSRIKVIEKPNGGVSSARNRGIALAEYNHLVFLDGDDEWLPSHLEEIRKLTFQFPEAGAYATNYWFRHQGNKLRKAKLGFEHKQYTQHSFLFNDYFRLASCGDLPVHSSSICIPAPVLRQLGNFPENEMMGEDQDLWARIALQYPMAFSTTRCVIYNLAADNRACDRIIPREECPFSKRLMDKLDNPTLSNTVRQQILKYTATHLLHIASQNILLGRYEIGKEILQDQRTMSSPLRRAFWITRTNVGMWKIRMRSNIHNSCERSIKLFQRITKKGYHKEQIKG